MYLCMYVYIPVCAHLRICVCAPVCGPMCVYVYMYICICESSLVCWHMHAHTYLCGYIWKPEEDTEFPLANVSMASFYLGARDLISDLMLAQQTLPSTEPFGSQEWALLSGCLLRWSGGELQLLELPSWITLQNELPQGWTPCSSVHVPTFLALKLKSDPLCLQMWLMVGFSSPQTWLAHGAFVDKQKPVTPLACQDRTADTLSTPAGLTWRGAMQ